ncbi:MAG: hypothetical protein IJ690_03000 [Clostridia bacterium]|nr:hypothetical protein [Clostridia bacterium]
MELITILVMSVTILAFLAILLRFNCNNIRLIKQIGEDNKLNEITNALPENEEICKQILKMLKNENVNIKVGNDNSQASLYVVATNSIFIANIKKTFTRVQTIAHECIHSVQDKRLLWFNFIFSNIYLLYFTTITILAVFNKLPETSVFAIILIMMSVLLYFVRSYLETDAMTKARYLAKEYMESKKKMINQEDINMVVQNYDRLNEVGVKFYNFKLLFDYLIKLIVFCVVALI